jgi:predicted Zn-dependent protease
MLDERTRGILMAARDEAASRGITATFALHREKSHLMRIGNNSVSLSTTEDLSRLDISVIDGRKQGTHTHLGRIQSGSTVRDALEICVTKAAMAMEKDYQPPADVVEETVDESPQFDPALEELDPAVKADAYDRIISGTGPDYNFSGSWSSGSTELYLVSTSNGNEAWTRGTDFRFTVVLKHPEKKWELTHVQTGWKASDFDADRTTGYFRELLPVFEDNEGFEVEPGEYTVLFGPEAIAELLSMAMWTGLYGRGWEEKMAWTSGSAMGDRILGENITLVDDPSNDRTFRVGFDQSGQRRKLFRIVENGKLRGLMYDSNTAAKYGRKPTGHNTGSVSCVMATGDGPGSPLEAARGMGRVLYIPALHYMNIPNRSKGIFTGSSRFSAVLVEDGVVVRPIFSSRITDSFGNVLGRVRVISPESESVNLSNTYGRREPFAMDVPTYMIAEGVKITDCAESF